MAARGVYKNNRTDGEQTIEGLSATCPHCDAPMTRGELQKHVAACPERVVLCAAQDVGCPWRGRLAEVDVLVIIY